MALRADDRQRDESMRGDDDTVVIRSSLGVLLAFAVVYVVWGSTYLAIRFAIESIPPLLMAGTRFVAAGAALYGWCAVRGSRRPTRTQWQASAITSLFLIAAAYGLVSWAELTVPSGIVAVATALTPLWAAGR